MTTIICGVRRLVNWHWLYRDFISASLKAQGSPEWVTEIQHSYIEAHACLLDAIHFTPRGFPTREEVQKRLDYLGYKRFEKLINTVGSDYERFEQRLISTAKNLLRKLMYTGDHQDVYVIVGLDCTNIYSTQLNGSAITVLCIEATDGDYEVIELLLAHECHHWRRQQQISDDIFNSSIGERMVSEGLASFFSQETQPGRFISDYCYVPSSTVEWVHDNWDLLNYLYSDLNESRFMSALFSRTPNDRIIDGMPPRTGYVYGYLKVREFLERSHKSASDMSGVQWKTVIDC